MEPFKKALEELEKLYKPSTTLQEIRKDIESRQETLGESFKYSNIIG